MAANRNFGLVDENAVAFDKRYFGFVYDKRTMHANKQIIRKQVFKI